MQKATLICDMQYGSTGKGLIAGYLAERDKPDTVVTAWAANAGHTYIDGDGNKYVHTMLANGVVSPNLERVMIGGGSLINPKNLEKEIRANAHLLEGRAVVYIHESAAIIYDSHAETEKTSMVAIGSTSKGVGESLQQKIRRDPMGNNTAKNYFTNPEMRVGDVKIKVINHSEWVNIMRHKARVIQIEGAQGYSLGINSGFYPYCTSRECTPRQIMVDCGIPHSIKPKVVGCLRTFPIRVANRYDEDGNQIGTSGGHYDDQEEITFAEIGQEPELTTVTQLPRRIFTWSDKQFIEAFDMVNPDEIFLNFCNYIENKHRFVKYIDRVNPTYLGFGATVNDVVDISTLPRSTAVNKFVDQKAVR